MPYLVTYEVEVQYRPLPGINVVLPVLEVTLYRGDQETCTVGLVDSGATHTVFSREYAELLGIADVTAGNCLRISTAGGPLITYLFDDVDMEIKIDGVQKRFSGQIGFAEGHLSRNTLGLNLLFQQFQIGFHDARQRFYMLTDLFASLAL